MKKMYVENVPMAEINSTTYKKWFEIPCITKGKTEEEIVDAVTEYADCFEREDVMEMINSPWMDICTDGIIIWMDGE